MIHLDRDPNELSSDHLILPEDHSAFSWVDIPHDDSQHNYLTSLSHLSTPEHVLPDSIQGQIPPPSSPPHPADDKSSSLSPPPEYPPPQIQHKNSPLPPLQDNPPPEQQEQNPDPDADGDGSYSRQLTPLTDLSAVPDGDESFDFEKKESNIGESDGQAPISDRNSDSKSATDKLEKRAINGSTTSSSPTTQPVPIAAPHHLFPIAGPSQSNQRPTQFTGPSHSIRPSSRNMISASQLPSPNISAAKGDTKVVRILEINSELFKYIPTTFPQSSSWLTCFIILGCLWGSRHLDL